MLLNVSRRDPKKRPGDRAFSHARPAARGQSRRRRAVPIPHPRPLWGASLLLRPWSNPVRRSTVSGPTVKREDAMAELPDRAHIVVIGAGVVGSAAVHHLAELGWRDIVLLEKGPLPDPGGSTGHASNFVFPVDHSKEITDLTVDSLRQYEDLGVLSPCGGIEVARSAERMQEDRKSTRLNSSH